MWQFLNINMRDALDGPPDEARDPCISSFRDLVVRSVEDLRDGRNSTTNL